MSNRWVVPVVLVALSMRAATLLAGGADPKKVLPTGACVYVEKMSGDLDGYIRAEMVNKRVPVKLVLQREQAHFVLTGASQDRKGSWHEGWLSADKDHATGSVMLVDRATNEMVWAAEAGDRSLFWGSLARGGPRKVASRLVEQLRETVFSPKLPLAPPPPLSEQERALAAQYGTGGMTEDQASSNRMTNEDVIKLASGGVSDDVIIAKIKNSQAAFSLDTDALVALKKAGVSDRVVTAMMEVPARKSRPPSESRRGGWAMLH